MSESVRISGVNGTWFAVATLCSLLGVFAACGDSLGIFQDGVLTYDLASDASEAVTFASYGTVTNVVKKGAGTLTLTVSNAGCSGDVLLEAGIMTDSAPLNGECCTGIGSAKTVTVMTGAQFKNIKSFGWSAQSTRRYSSTFYIEGAGPDGNGALSFAGGGPGDCMYNKIVMTGLVDQRGGVVRKLRSFNLSGGGTGVVYLAGGTFLSRNTTSSLGMGAYDWADNASRAGRGILTVDGSNALVDMDVGTILGQRTNNFVGVVNINPGADPSWIPRSLGYFRGLMDAI